MSSNEELKDYKEAQEYNIIENISLFTSLFMYFSIGSLTTWAIARYGTISSLFGWLDLMFGVLLVTVMLSLVILVIYYKNRVQVDKMAYKKYRRDYERSFKNQQELIEKERKKLV